MSGVLAICRRFEGRSEGDSRGRRDGRDDEDKEDSVRSIISRGSIDGVVVGWDVGLELDIDGSNVPLCRIFEFEYL